MVVSTDDPVILGFWLANYEATLADSVDELLLAINGPHALDIPVTASKARVFRFPEANDHGWCLEQMYPRSAADVFLFTETDAWLRRPGIAGEWFAAIESGECDVVGSPRHPASLELVDEAERRWGQIDCGEDHGTGFWPCFLTISRAALDRTDRRFGARQYPVGTEIPGLHITSGELTTDETFVGVSWQLRDTGARVRLIPQHRVARGTTCHPDSANWFHVGSLSAAPGMAWGKVTNEHTMADTPAEEMARRLALWWTIAAGAPPSDRRDVFDHTLDGLMARLRLPFPLVEYWRDYYAPWFRRADDPMRSIAA